MVIYGGKLEATTENNNTDILVSSRIKKNHPVDLSSLVVPHLGQPSNQWDRNHWFFGVRASNVLGCRLICLMFSHRFRGTVFVLSWVVHVVWVNINDPKNRQANIPTARLFCSWFRWTARSQIDPQPAVQSHDTQLDHLAPPGRSGPAEEVKFDDFCAALVTLHFNGAGGLAAHMGR